MRTEFTDTKIVERGIKWDDLTSNGMIEKNEMIMLKGFIQSPDTQNIALGAYGIDYCKIFLKLMTKLKCVEYLKILISLIDKYIETFADILLGLQGEFQPFEMFINYIRIEDTNFFIKAKSSNIIGTMLLYAKNRKIDEQFIRANTFSVIRWSIRDLEKVEDLNDLDLMLNSLKTILRYREGRSFFFSLNGLQILEKFLLIPHDDIVYNSLYCIWLLSYHKEVIKSISENSIKKIVQTLKSTRCQKIIRISIGIIRNLAELNQRNRECIIESNLIKLFPQFVHLKYEDREFKINLEYLETKLKQTIEHMTSWPIYKDRILSDSLQRSILHKDELFWKTLIPHFGEDNFEIIGVLINSIQSPDPEKVTVALYHIGNFIKYHPASHRILNIIPDTKAKLMAKLDDPDPKVQLEALFTIQRLVLKY